MFCLGQLRSQATEELFMTVFKFNGPRWLVLHIIKHVPCEVCDPLEGGVESQVARSQFIQTEPYVKLWVVQHALGLDISNDSSVIWVAISFD